MASSPRDVWDRDDGRSVPSASWKELPIEWGEEIEPQLSALWLVKKTLPRQGLALIYGHSGSGKSFLAIDFAMHVALGRDWNGLQTHKGLVVYVAAEGQRGLKNRIVAFRQHYGLTGPLPLAVIPVPVDLHDPHADRSALARAVRRAADRYGMEPALIVVDTISKTIGAGKENTDDLAVYVANCGSLAAEFECCVLPIHHRPKDADSKDPRGHSSLKAGVDTVILVQAGKTKRAEITKQKDDEERDLLMFALQPIEIGVDDEGDPVTSCVVMPTLVDANTSGDAFQRKLLSLKSDNHRVVVDQIGKALESEGIVPPDEIPDDQINRSRVGRVVDMRKLQDRCLDVLRTQADVRPDTPRTQLKRALQKLHASRIIGIWKDWVWFTHE